MGFWIFMMTMDLLIPLTMIFYGNYFIKNVPKEINEVFGYRTSMSMKNKDTWQFAHQYFGRIWLVVGAIMIVPSMVTMLFVIGQSVGVIGTFGGILCAIQLVFLVVSIFPTEKALKDNFDQYGKRKKI